MRPFRLPALAAPLLLLSFAAPVLAKGPVTSVQAYANPRNYAGECPAPLEFVGLIKVSRHPVVVEYLWERSNGTRSQVRRIQVRSGLQRITDEWGVGGPPGDPMQVWEKLKILSPSTLSSATAKATVRCK